MLLGKKALVVSASAGAGFSLVLLLFLGRTAFHSSPVKPPGSWNQDAIKATYVGSQLRQIDKALAALFLAYDLENNTDRDYRLADASHVVIICSLKSVHRLTHQAPIRRSYPAFLTVNQR